ncbi:MAG: imidazole glycerol phosphate synthase subunit HisF [Tissierellaceae bacterium]|nr:imidazole glycerol phosphate synthase subunit HisF [Tissierellaceae bacterium]
MAIKRIIPCLDIRNGKVVKGKKFKDINEVDDPETLAYKYWKDGADELVFYDITASLEDRNISLEFINKVANKIDIPITVGGGINTIEDVEDILSKGAAKVSINTGALKNPKLIKESAVAFGSEKVVLALDVKKIGPNKWNVFTSGGKVDTGKDAIQWAVEGEKMGAGELVINSIDEDGMKKGYDLELLKLITSKVNVPVIASGGAGKLDHFAEGIQIGGADGVLAASVFHYGELTVKEVKEYMKSKGIEVQL